MIDAQKKENGELESNSLPPPSLVVWFDINLKGSELNVWFDISLEGSELNVCCLV